MAVNLRGKSYLKLLDFTSAEIRYLLELSKDYPNVNVRVIAGVTAAASGAAVLPGALSGETRQQSDCARGEPGAGDAATADCVAG